MFTLLCIITGLLQTVAKLNSMGRAVECRENIEKSGIQHFILSVHEHMCVCLCTYTGMNNKNCSRENYSETTEVILRLFYQRPNNGSYILTLTCGINYRKGMVTYGY